MSAQDDEILTFNIVDANKKILFYLSIIVFPVGFVLNIASMLVFTSKTFRKCNIGFYNTFIAVNNNLTLIFAFLIFFTQSSGNDVLLWSNISCRSLNYIYRVFVMNNSWLNVLLTLDRMVCLGHQNKYKYIKSKKTICLMIAGVFLVVMAINLPNSMFSVISVSHNNSLTNMTETSKLCSSVDIGLRDGLTIIFRIILPFILMFCFNVSLIKNLFAMKKKLKVSRELQKEYNLASSIVALNVLFFTSLLPNAICLILLNIVQYGFISQLSSLSLAVVNVCFSISIFFASYNDAFPFFINLKFNLLFRKVIIFFFKYRKTAALSF